MSREDPMHDSWSVRTTHASHTWSVSQYTPEPRVASVPVALVGSGVLLASIGITRSVRRRRAFEV